MGTNRLYSEGAAGNENALEQIISSEQSGVDPNLRLISLFNHYRHDWMNDIQVLFGYVKLKKYDKLEQLMDKIKTKVQRESNISKLGIPELIVYLLSVQAEVKDLLLEVEMLQEIHLNELPMDGQKFSGLLIGLIEAYKSNAQLHSDGEHRLMFELIQKADYVQLNLHYQGEVAMESLRAKLQEMKNKHGQSVAWEIKLFEERQSVMHIQVPFQHKEVDSCS